MTDKLTVGILMNILKSMTEDKVNPMSKDAAVEIMLMQGVILKIRGVASYQDRSALIISAYAPNADGVHVVDDLLNPDGTPKSEGSESR